MHTPHRDPCSAETVAQETIGEQVAEEFEAGKLDHEFGEWLRRTQPANILADVVQAYFGGDVRVTERGLEITTIPSEYGWRRPPQFVPVSPATIGEAFRETGHGLCDDFVSAETIRRMEEDPDA